MTGRRWVPLLAAVALAAATTSTAYALTRDDGTSPTKVRTAAEVYSDDMSLDQISELSKGKAGTVAPPCPSEEVVAKLKSAGLPVGPCDPFPERDAPAIVPTDDQSEPEDDPNSAMCVTVTGIDAEHKLNLPCAVGVKLIDTKYPTVKGEECVAVTYIPKRGADAITETLCPSSPKSEGGATLGAPGSHTDHGPSSEGGTE